MSPSRFFASLGAAAVLVAASAVPGQAGAVSDACSSPGLGVGIVDVPKGAKDPRAQVYVIDHVEPGAEFVRRFQVCNGTTQPIAVQLYAGAASISGSAFRIIEGRAENELSRWITVERPQVTIPAGRRVLVGATFAVPEDAEPGERYAVLLAELPAQSNGSGVSVASRVGVRVYLDVGQGDAPRSDFRIDSMQAARAADGSPLVTARVVNTGGRALDLSGSLSLRDGPGGLAGGPFPADLGTTLAPGDSGPVKVVLDRAISGGPWLATLTLNSGLLQRRAEAALTFPDEAGASAAPVKAENLPLREDPDVVIPIAIGVFSLALLLLLFILYRRRNHDRDDEEDVAQ